jgi:hypothetical protein
LEVAESDSAIPTFEGSAPMVLSSVPRNLKT